VGVHDFVEASLICKNILKIAKIIRQTKKNKIGICSIRNKTRGYATKGTKPGLQQKGYATQRNTTKGKPQNKQISWKSCRKRAL